MSGTTFTIIPEQWECTPEELSNVDPRRLLANFRTDLYGKGTAKASGWLFAFIHGEFDPVARVFRLHVHGFATGGMLAVLDRLRKMDNYRSVRKLPDGEWNPVYRRVWIRRKPLINLPSPLTYLVQAFWPSRPIYISKEGKRRRVRDKQRMPEPYHSQVLLWLDRWRLADLTLMVGLRVTKSGLIRTKR